MRKALTARFVETVTAPAGRTEYVDTITPGLALRVGPRAKTWIALYKTPAGKVRRQKIGRYPALKLEKARRKAQDIMGGVHEGHDPFALEQAAQADTFAALVALYLRQHARRHKRTWKEDQRILAKDFAAWNDVPVRTLTRRMIRERLDELAARAPVQANRSLAALSTVLNFGVDREWLDANPAARLKKPSVEVSRSRVLSDDEIRELWSALDAAELAYRAIADEGRRVMVRRLDGDTPLLRPMFADWLRLRLLTGQRGGEVLAMRRQDIDVEAAVWAIPATVAKNKSAHLVPLSAAALEVVTSRLAAVEPSCAWLFPNDLETGPARDRAKKIALSTFLPDADDVRGHDLRRTAASGMARLGISRDTIARVLNHVERGPRSTSVYDRFDRLPEKRTALEAWARELVRIRTAVTSSKVVPFGR